MLERIIVMVWKQNTFRSVDYICNVGEDNCNGLEAKHFQKC